MASYIPPLGGTTLTGSVDDWQAPDGYWTEEFGAELESARAEQRPATCPICGEANAVVSMDAINAERATPDGFTQFAGRLGTLIRLGTCGHTIKR